MTAKVLEPEALKLANEYLVALDHDTLENPTNALALLIQGVKDGAAERAAAEVSGLRATLKLVERALPAGAGTPSFRIRELRLVLEGVLEALDLLEAYENGHNVVAAAKALAKDIEDMGAALLAAERVCRDHGDTFDFLATLRGDIERGLRTPHDHPAKKGTEHG